MNVIKRVKFFWHYSRYRFNSIVFEDCLCNEMKAKILRKINYHREKVREVGGIEV
jgi:hypothetical protein